jgi:hypothetical protein
MNFFKENLYNYSTILELYCLNQFFFEKALPEEIDRFNSVLNLQWAIDLKKELDELPN